MTALATTQNALTQASRFMTLLGPLLTLTPLGAAAPGVAQIINAAASYSLMGSRAAHKLQLLNREVQHMVDNQKDPTPERVESILDHIETESIEFLGWTPPSESAPEIPE